MLNDARGPALLAGPHCAAAACRLRRGRRLVGSFCFDSLAGQRRDPATHAIGSCGENAQCGLRWLLLLLLLLLRTA